MIGTKRRGVNGTTMAEMPVALWLIILMCFSLLVLATETLRFGFFWNACREAAQQAAKCQTFQNDSSTGPSSVTEANTWAQKATSSFSGLTLTSVNVYIVQTNVNSRVTTKNPPGQKLAAAADITNNIYSIQVQLSGQVEPLTPVTFQGVFGNIPGLTGPFPVVVRSQYSCEVPQGLNQ